MNVPKMLIIDEDANVCDMLASYLEKEKYDVKIAYDGIEAIKLFDNILPDVVLLDVKVTGISGWELCKYIRRKSDSVIIIISTKNDIFDKLRGFDLGADDYISKPFDVKEVLARIRAVLRRLGKCNVNNIFKVEYDKLIVDIRDYKACVNGQAIKMPPKEMELLFFLASKPNRVFTRNVLLDELWGVECYVDIRTVDVHIKRVRGKIEGISDKWSLKTIWGVGYKFETYY